MSRCLHVPAPGTAWSRPALCWPVRAVSTDPWQRRERPVRQADPFQTHLRRWFTVYFASLHFLFLEQLTREMAAVNTAALQSALQQLVNHLRTMWLRPCDVDGAGVRTQDLGSHSAAWPGRGTGGPGRWVPDPRGCAVPRSGATGGWGRRSRGPGYRQEPFAWVSGCQELLW